MIRKSTKIIASIIIALLLMTVGVIYYSYTHDFHSVIPGQFYRGPQLDEAQFQHFIKVYNIKTIINLRGAHPKSPWYQSEIAVTKTDNVKHYDFKLKSKTLPDTQTLKKLVTVIDTVPRPILVHCQSGVDRSGLASVIALLLNDEKSTAVINKQVSYEYFAYSNESVGKQLLRYYNAWLKKNNLTMSRKTFLHWLGSLPPGNKYSPRSDN